MNNKDEIKKSSIDYRMIEDFLAKKNGLIKVDFNKWVNESGSTYMFTKLGFSPFPTFKRIAETPKMSKQLYGLISLVFGLLIGITISMCI